MKQLYLVMSLCLLGLVGCGDPSKTVAVRDIEIHGDIGEKDADECFQIMDGKYTFKIKGDNLLLDIPLKTIGQVPDMSIEKVNEFAIAILDKDEEYIQVSPEEDMVEMNVVLDNSDIMTKLFASNIGDINNLQFSYTLLGDVEILEKIASFELWIDIDLAEKSSVNKHNNSSNNWDKILDSYEIYVDRYIQLAKKAQNGDISAISEYAQCLEKAEELQKQLENADSNLSTNQLNRLNKIIAKLATAASEISIDIDDDDDDDDDDF